jgi:hypothetical protein
VALERVPPTLVLLIDQSGSMEQDMDGSSRWTRLVEALTAPQSPLRARNDELRLGLTLFTSNAGFGTNPAGPRTCPVFQSVDAARTGYSNLESVLLTNFPSGDSPGAESLAVVAHQLAAAPDASPASILWIVDGYTDSCEAPLLADETASTALSVQALTEAFDLGVPTQLIDLGLEASPASLSALAQAGAGGDITASAFHPTTAGELATALATTVDRVQSCEFVLPAPMTAMQAAGVSVALGTTELVWAATDGWELKSPSRLRLRGGACTELKSAAATVTLRAQPCP